MPTIPVESPVKIRRALLSVSDKTGLVELATALAARRRRTAVHRRHRQGIARRRPGGTRRHRGHRLSGNDGRPGQDPAPDGPRRPAGPRGTDDAVMAEHGIAAIDLLVLNLYPFEARHGRSRLQAGRRGREHRHRRPGDAAFGGEEFRPRRRGDRSVAIRAASSRNSMRSDGALSAKTRFALSVAAFNRVAQYDACDQQLPVRDRRCIG